MILLGSLLNGIATVLDLVLTLALILIIVRAVISWFSPDPYNPLVRFLNSSTEPLFTPIRRKVKTVFGGIDLAPIFLIFLIYFLKAFLVVALRAYAQNLLSG
jgi:YggT family protein